MLVLGFEFRALLGMQICAHDDIGELNFAQLPKLSQNDKQSTRFAFAEHAQKSHLVTSQQH